MSDVQATNDDPNEEEQPFSEAEPAPESIRLEEALAAVMEDEELDLNEFLDGDTDGDLSDTGPTSSVGEDNSIPEDPEPTTPADPEGLGDGLDPNASVFDAQQYLETALGRSVTAEDAQSMLMAYAASQNQQALPPVVEEQPPTPAPAPVVQEETNVTLTPENTGLSAAQIAELDEGSRSVMEGMIRANTVELQKRLDAQVAPLQERLTRAEEYALEQERARLEVDKAERIDLAQSALDKFVEDHPQYTVEEHQGLVDHLATTGAHTAFIDLAGGDVVSGITNALEATIRSNPDLASKFVDQAAQAAANADAERRSNLDALSGGSGQSGSAAATMSSEGEVSSLEEAVRLAMNADAPS